MLEIIFQRNDLENILQCFLSLNSHQHHGVIIENFTDIWGAMFHGTKNPPHLSGMASGGFLFKCFKLL
jgi:hypothetical protein